MNVSGVGGGFLAMAGGLQGAGQGIAQVGADATKLNLETKLNQMALDRETTVTRLQGQQAKDLEAQRGAEQEKIQGSQQTFETGQTQTKLTAASAAAGATREFEKGENQKKLASEEKRTGITAQSRIDAAAVRASASAGNRAPPKVWEVHTVSSADPKNPAAPPSQTQILVNNRSGASYMQLGDKLVRYNSQTRGPAVSPESLARAPAGDVQDLLADPLGLIPNGPNKGLSKAEAFEAKHNYIPSAWTSAATRAEQARQQQSTTSLSLPSGLVRSVGGPNATSAKVASFGGGGADEDDGSENAAQSDEDASSGSPPFQSGAMTSYSNSAQ
jgi:hypothetical protein